MPEPQNLKRGAPGATEEVAMGTDHPMPGAGATASHAGGAPENVAAEARAAEGGTAGPRDGSEAGRSGGSHDVRHGTSYDDTRPQQLPANVGGPSLSSFPSRRSATWERDFGWLEGPGRLIRGFFDQIARMADEIGSSREWLPSEARSASRDSSSMIGPAGVWSPVIEVFERGDELVISADLPGLSKNDVTIEVADDAVIIQGERRTSNQSQAGGVYRSERSYGHFSRKIPLPPGADTAHARATFADGVLELVIPAPNRGSSRRRIDIS